MDETREEILLTRELIRIESSDPGTYEGAMADFVSRWLRENTAARVTLEPVLPGRSNVAAVLEGASRDHELVYLCHMDTMPAGEGWSVPALEGIIQDGRLYGRGACDMKGGLAAAMLALRNLSGRPLRYDFRLVATVDEEDRMRGSERAVADGLAGPGSWVLDSEPTAGRIQAGHKGKTWFELRTHGRTGHASTPEKGADAVAAMAEILTRISAKLDRLPRHPEMGPCTAVFGSIRGGWNPYIVPDECAATVDLRLVPPVSNEESIALVKEAVEEGLAVRGGVTCDVEVTAQRPAIQRDDGSAMLKCLREAVEEVTGKAAEVGFFPGYTDGAVVAALTGNRDCVSYGPGSLEQAHRPDEFVPCEDVVRCAGVLTRVAEKMVGAPLAVEGGFCSP